MRMLICLSCRLVSAVRETAGSCECPACAHTARVANLAVSGGAIMDIIEWVSRDPHLVDQVLDRIRVTIPRPGYPRGESNEAKS